MKEKIEPVRYRCDMCGSEVIGADKKLPPGWSEPSITSPLNYGSSITSSKQICPSCSKSISDAHFKAMYPKGISVTTGECLGSTVTAGSGR